MSKETSKFNFTADVTMQNSNHFIGVFFFEVAFFGLIIMNSK